MTLYSYVWVALPFHQGPFPEIPIFRQKRISKMLILYKFGGYSKFFVNKRKLVRNSEEIRCLMTMTHQTAPYILMF